MTNNLPKYIVAAPKQHLPVNERENLDGLGYFDQRTGEIVINADLDPVGKHHILLHEMIHLAVEKCKQGGLIKRAPSENVVTYLTGALFPMLALSNLWNGVSPEEAEKFIMDNYETEQDESDGENNV
jgi:hypothetical protein